MSCPQNNYYENSQKRIEKRRMEEIKKKVLILAPFL